MLIHASLFKTWAIRTRGHNNLTMIIRLSVRIKWDIQPNSEIKCMSKAIEF